jgi:cyclophilin family peptidyl-prolyl cis-trans isomerase
MGMALSGKGTGGSQFFFCHTPQPHLDSGYSAWERKLRASTPRRRRSTKRLFRRADAHRAETRVAQQVICT